MKDILVLGKKEFFKDVVVISGIAIVVIALLLIFAVNTKQGWVDTSYGKAKARWTKKCDALEERNQFWLAMAGKYKYPEGSDEAKVIADLRTAYILPNPSREEMRQAFKRLQADEDVPDFAGDELFDGNRENQAFFGAIQNTKEGKINAVVKKLPLKPNAKAPEFRKYSVWKKVFGWPSVFWYWLVISGISLGYAVKKVANYRNLRSGEFSSCQVLHVEAADWWKADPDTHQLRVYLWLVHWPITITWLTGIAVVELVKSLTGDKNSKIRVLFGRIVNKRRQKHTDEQNPYKNQIKQLVAAKQLAELVRQHNPYANQLELAKRLQDIDDMILVLRNEPSNVLQEKLDQILKDNAAAALETADSTLVSAANTASEIARL